MSLPVHEIKTVNKESFPYIFEQNILVTLRNGGLIRCNVYRPKSTETGQKYPVLATYGPYGKDIPYKEFNPVSYSLINPDHQTEHSSWETPTPTYWTARGYVVVRADELGTGQSPGIMNPFSAETTDAFYELIEWASEQTWSTGKVGLLGISYFAATQWQVAARNPKGLSVIIPWEGFSDYYRDAERHGGILSSKFYDTWWNNQVVPNQYGLPGRAARHYGPDTVDGSLSEKELEAYRVDQPTEGYLYRYRDHKRFTSVNFNLEDVTVPLLSVANWGGLGLHLRGNVYGFMHASSKFKYLRFIVGRHDLPFYYGDEVEVQRSFLDAFLKGEDRVGWSKEGQVPAVSLLLRKGDVGYGDAVGEKQFPRRTETKWPISNTQYTRFYLGLEKGLLPTIPDATKPQKLSYKALGTPGSPYSVSFVTPHFESETEITGHITTHLNVSVSGDAWSSVPSDIDLFLTLRHISSSGKEIFYTGSFGDPTPVTRGFLRVSLRKVNAENSSGRHQSWLPHRDYSSADVLPVIPNEVYDVDVELWPTNVVVQVGGRLLLEVSSGDTKQTGVWEHNDPQDRSPNIFQGMNHVHFGPSYVNYLTLPIIPAR